MNKDKLVKIFILITIFCIILNTKLNLMDEFWNFSFASNVANGLIPYKDFNVIVTPLSFLINSIFLLFKQFLFIYRLVYFLYMVYMVFILDKIFTKLNIKSMLKYISIFGISLLLLNFAILEYNFIQLLLILTIIYLLLINESFKSNKLNIISSLLVGLTLTNKQSTGLIIICSYLFLIFIYKKLDIKFYIKHILYICIPSFIMFLYLLITNSLNDFIDQCILGISTFVYDSYCIPYVLISYLIISIIIIAFLFHYKEYRYRVLFIFSLASFVVAYPLFDIIHVSIGLVIPIVFLVNHFNKYIINPRIYHYIFIAILSIISIYSVYDYSNSFKVEHGVYKFLKINKKDYDRLIGIDNYINNNSKDKKVYMLAIYTTFYKIPINSYDKYFDLSNKGNLGCTGIDKMKSIIDEENNIFIVDEVHNNLTPEEVIDYIKKGYYKCDEIYKLNVYCKNKD